ncbi:MAG: enoyl-CoA hydratase-related protein [Rubrivivax sp.]
MRILLLAHAFNSLTQRLWTELRADGHELSLELDIADAVSLEAVEAFDPDLVLAPFLKRAIPEPIWSRRLTLVVHPGPPGDRGPSALDHALLEGLRDWGVTVLQAAAGFDEGPVWAWQPCTLRAGATKGSSYRHEVVDAAVAAVRAALARVVPGRATPLAATLPSLPLPRGWRPLVTRAERAVDWGRHAADEARRRIASADGAPGAAGTLFGQPCKLFDAHAASAAAVERCLVAAPGQVIARRGPALLVRCAEGALWIGHVRRGDDGLKLAAVQAFPGEAAALPEWPVPLMRADDEWDELRYTESGPPEARVGRLDVDVLNGALSERASTRLLAALREVAARPAQVLLLAGGADFFCNGIDLHAIEAAAAHAGDSAADASMRAIEAIDDVALALLQMTDRVTVAALRGNAGAGGCFLALAADRVWAHAGVVQNPHYKNMGNLYGSEYWTYLLPRRVGPAEARAITQGRLPMGAAEAQARGLVDEVLGADATAFEALLPARAAALAQQADGLVVAKRRQRAADEALRPLAAYRADELARLRRNFYGFDPSYHVARHHFVHRKPHAWTPRHLALHRRPSPR